MEHLLELAIMLSFKQTELTGSWTTGGKLASYVSYCFYAQQGKKHCSLFVVNASKDSPFVISDSYAKRAI